jgi:hypothetical protein
MLVKKVITKNQYGRFVHARSFIIDRRDLGNFHDNFIKVFTARRQLSRAKAAMILKAALAGEVAAREFIETYLIKGMGIEEDDKES